MIEYWWLTIALVAIMSVHFAQFSVGALRWWFHRLQNAEQLRQRLAILSQASQVARLTSQMGNSSLSMSAVRWRILEVADVVQESIDCRSYYLVDPYGQPLPDFRPGQYIMVRPALAGAYQATRCYSLSSSPDARYWRITVKHQAAVHEPARGTSGGLSAWLHRGIGKGDCLFVGGPSGQFYLPDESAKDIVLIAAGVGITPLASMLRWSLEHIPDRRVTLLYQVKNREHWPLGRAIHRWQSDFASMRAHTFLSRAEKDEIESLSSQLSGQFHAGKLDGAAAARLADNANAEYYICGPDAWMENIREQLVDGGVRPERIHWESFGSHAAPSIAESTEFDAHTIRFAVSETECQWHDPDQSIWECAKANQIEIASGCLSGVCGSCRVKLISGQVQYDRQVAVELASGECLTCVAHPITDLVLEA